MGLDAKRGPRAQALSIVTEMTRLLTIGGVLLGVSLSAHARDIYVLPPTRPAQACHASREALAACVAERRRWELFKCNRKPIEIGVLLCRWDVD
jgi:hypothetical protein